jgi:adenylate cyclase
MVQGLYERFQLSKFVSSSTISSIQNREKGAKALMTLFFSDIRGFTSFSESKLPEQVVDSLNKVLNIQTEIIHRNGGDVDKYVGDEVVALFTGEDQARRACRSALEIQRALGRAAPAEYAGLRVGIGVNTGEIILGMIGSEQRADYTVIGDHVNLASRLCDAAKPDTVLISDSTYRSVGKAASVSRPYSIRVKGKEEPQKVYFLKALKVSKA